MNIYIYCIKKFTTYLLISHQQLRSIYSNQYFHMEENECKKNELNLNWYGAIWPIDSSLPCHESNRLIVSRRRVLAPWIVPSIINVRGTRKWGEPADHSSFQTFAFFVLSSMRHFNRACKVRTRAPLLPRHRRRQKIESRNRW